MTFTVGSTFSGVGCLDRHAGGADDNDARVGHLIVHPSDNVTNAVTSRIRKGANTNATEPMVAYAPIVFDTTQITSPGNWSNPQEGDPCHPLAATAKAPAVVQPFVFETRSLTAAAAGTHADAKPHVVQAYGIRSDAVREGVAVTPCPDAEGRVRLRNPGLGVYHELSPTLDAGAPHITFTGYAVRRLMPIECERLQGFPDDWTRWGRNGREMKDAFRYRSTGNAITVPKLEWIFRRMMEVHTRAEV